MSDGRMMIADDADGAGTMAQREGTWRATRRDFLRWAGIGGAALFLPSFLTACNEDPFVVQGSTSFDLSTDNGVLNVAYASAQFRSEFYKVVNYAPFLGASALESGSVINGVFGRLAAHMSSQRLFFQNSGIITQNRISDNIPFQFQSVDFTKRDSVCGFAINAEDKAAEMLCDLMTRCKDASTVALLGKIASLDARRAAALRDLADVAAGNANTANRVSFAADAVVSPTTGLEAETTVEQYVALMQTHSGNNLSLSGV